MLLIGKILNGVNKVYCMHITLLAVYTRSARVAKMALLKLCPTNEVICWRALSDQTKTLGATSSAHGICRKKSQVCVINYAAQ